MTTIRGCMQNVSFLSQLLGPNAPPPLRILLNTVDLFLIPMGLSCNAISMSLRTLICVINNTLNMYLLRSALNSVGVDDWCMKK